MIDNYFRAQLPRAVGPLLKLYAFFRLRPNHVTLLGFFVALVAAYLIAINMLVAAIAVWWISRIFDGTDGIYARSTGQTSRFGSYLDIVADMASYSAVIVAFDFAFPNLHSLWMIVLLLYVLCITSALALGNLEEQANVGRRDNRGLRLAAGVAEGGETGIAYTLFLLFPNWLSVSVPAWIAILSLTVVSRTWLAARELK